MVNTHFTHSKISPTAKMIAHWRQYANLPFSKDIAEVFHTADTMRAIFPSKNFDLLYSSKAVFIPYVEIRYKFLEEAIRTSGIKQILEFASGITLRGLAMTEDSSLTYVETDLPEIMEEKTKLLGTIMDRYNIKSRPNLHFHTTNILNMNDIENALHHFDPQKPVMVVHEGLFQYLTREERTIATKNIYTILSKFKGQWITPDLDTQKDMDSDLVHNESEVFEAVRKITNRSLKNNSFKDDDDLEKFFHDLGFSIETRPQWSKNIQLSTLDVNNASKTQLDGLKQLRFWILEKA
jgi:O-methyltransferase involved in polyketide biosynthesis